MTARPPAAASAAPAIVASAVQAPAAPEPVLRGVGMRTQVAEMARWREEAPAHFVTGVPSCTAEELKAFMLEHKIELPKRRVAAGGKVGRFAKAERVAAILEWDRELRLEAEKTRATAKKQPKEPEPVASEKASDGSSDESESEASDSEASEEEFTSSESSSSEEEPPTPPPRKKKTAKKPVVAPKDKKAAKPEKPAKAEKPTKRTKPAPAPRKTKPKPPPSSSDDESDEDQDGDSGTESVYESDDDQPTVSAELKILLAEASSGNSSAFVRRKLRDTRLKKQFVAHLAAMVKSRKLSPADARDIREDYSL